MTELALDHVQGNPLASHLDGVRVAKLMRGKAPPDTGIEREAPELRSCRGSCTTVARRSGR
jgi:hypothetical protein